MQKLRYYEFMAYPQEYNYTDSRPYESMGSSKLYSNMKLKIDSPKYISNQFFGDEQSDYYHADQKIPQKTINFYDFKVDEVADGLDDFMTSVEIGSYYGFFLSPKTKLLFSKFKIPDHKYYPVDIHFKEKIYSYYYLLIANSNQKINFDKSVFVERFKKTNEVQVSDYFDLLQFEPATAEKRAIYRKKLIKEKIIVFDEAPDIYSVVTSANSFFYVSERLKNAIIDEGLTGYLLHEEKKIEFYKV